jgi:predicted DNA-binding transcriptional regulator AlpA
MGVAAHTVVVDVDRLRELLGPRPVEARKPAAAPTADGQELRALARELLVVLKEEAVSRTGFRPISGVSDNTLVIGAQHFAELLGVKLSAFWSLTQEPGFPRARTRRGGGRKRVWLRSEAEEHVRNLPLAPAGGGGTEDED